jgi:hypothetical protein
MKRTAKILFCLSVMLPMAVHAQIIMCKDASGKTYTSDRPIMECADRPIREFGKNGFLKREIPAPLTAEQRRQKQLEEEKRKAEEIALAEKKQADRALLARYRNEGDIEVARRRTLEIVQEQINRHADTLAVAEKRHQDVQSEIAQAKNKKDAPPGLQRRLEESGKALGVEKQKRHAYEAELVKINQQYDATANRYRELNNRQSTASK